MNATKNPMREKISMMPPRVGRVILNPPVGLNTRYTWVTRVASLRRVGDNAPYLGLFPISLLFFYEPNA
jgi:hypothetical protein